MATDMECIVMLYRRSTALLTGEGFVTMGGVKGVDPRAAAHIVKAAAMLSVAATAMLLAMAQDEPKADKKE